MNNLKVLSSTKAPFHEVEMTEPEEEHEGPTYGRTRSLSMSRPPQTKATSPKRTVLIVSFGGILFGLIVGLMVAFLSGDPSESAVSDGNQCASNPQFSSQTLKSLVDRPVTSLLKPKNLKGCEAIFFESLPFLLKKNAMNLLLLYNCNIFISSFLFQNISDNESLKLQISLTRMVIITLFVTLHGPF
jgi:hypothetical protein